MQSWGTTERDDALDRCSRSIDRLTGRAGTWSTGRLLDEGLDLVRDTCWADAAALVRHDAGEVRALRRRPEHFGLDAWCSDVPSTWFPWGLGTLNPDRFLLVERAAALPVAPGSPFRLGDLGVASAMLLPLREQERPSGGLVVLWREPRLAWDDERGRLLRTLGRFLLARAAG
jgi:hypothetical protein